MDDYSAWIGKQEERSDILDPARSNALALALGAEDGLAAGAALPLLHHWLYFWDVRPPQGLGVDGHPARGGFLPPVALPRRMWAGGRLRFLAPLTIGDTAHRTSTITDVKVKDGRSGSLVFVTVRHEVAGAQGLAIVEEQDIVYREAAAAGSVSLPASGEAPQAAWQSQLLPDPILLFRYSALTMNGHRIHYDRPYAEREEAYPGLVVHGPLQATLLAALGARNLPGPATTFEFRGLSPAFDGLPLHICGDPDGDGVKLRTVQGANTCMTATISCAQA
jgi:3-methylfumaryl-CoA hydratase